MDAIWIVLICIAGLLLGGLVGWLLAVRQHSAAIAPLQQERATLSERVAAQSTQIDQGVERERVLMHRVEELGAARKEADDGRARAEERAAQLPSVQGRAEEAEKRLREARVELAGLQEERGHLQSDLASERRKVSESIATLDDAQKRLREAFASLAADALRTNSEEFLKLAKGKLAENQTEARADLEARRKEVEHLVKPIQETLDKLNAQVLDIDSKREQSFGRITEQVGNLAEVHKGLQRETGNLVKALRQPHVRGRWGEIQLRRVVELAGMLDHCDFSEQVSVESDQGRQRPDLLIHLPGGATIVVDSKVPLMSYLAALEAETDAQRDNNLLEHSRQVRTHIAQLSAKAYWDQFKPAPQFVVMFLPSEPVFSAALEKDPALIEDGVMQHVIVATPTTLIALLKAAAYGWQSEQVRQNAEEIRVLGNDLYTRVVTLCEHFEGIRRGLASSVGAYNKAVGSMESRVLPQARRFRDLGATTLAPIESLDPVDQVPRTLELPEFDPGVSSTEPKPSEGGADRADPDQGPTEDSVPPDATG